MGKRVAAERIEISNRSLDKIRPSEKPRIIWDSKLTGFGVKVMPSGSMSYLVNYRADGGGRKAPNRRMVIGRHGTISPAKARQRAQEILGAAAGGKDPSSARQERRAMPTLGDIFENYMAANPNRKPRTDALYRYEMDRYLGDWQNKPISSITRSDIQDRFNSISRQHGPTPANRVMSLLRSVYRSPCAEDEALRNPVEIWQAGGGRFNKKPRRKIDTPADILPKWQKGFEAVQNGVIRDAISAGLYTGMRLREVLWLKWSDISDSELIVEETKTGEPLRLPITRQLADVFERRKKDNETGWVFPNSETKSGHHEDIHHVYPTITKGAGTKFWFHALRNNFITIAERDIGLATSLTKRLVNHARPQDVTEGYAADWTFEQLLRAAQSVADRIDALIVAPANAL
ncbi:tyrosine-type recombinase/integrase [Magnetospira thiophila]